MTEKDEIGILKCQVLTNRIEINSCLDNAIKASHADDAFQTELAIGAMILMVAFFFFIIWINR